jgi:hypothetical protein
MGCGVPCANVLADIESISMMMNILW